MSKAKAAAAPPPPEVPTEPVKDPLANVDPEEAMTRFAPFVFTIDSDTKECVDLKGTLDIVSRDPSLALGQNFFILDRQEVVQWFAALEPVGHAAPAAQAIADTKVQQAQLVEGGGDINLLASAFKYKIRHIAMQREAIRLEEVEAANQRHEELVERLMEEGLTRREAEAAAKEEEEAANAAEAEAAAAANGGNAEEALELQRPVAYVLLKGFPTVPDQVTALQKSGITLNAVFIVNSKAKFGRRDDPAPVDPKAAKGKKPEPKKVESKKAGGKGKVDDTPVAPTESIGLLLLKEIAKLPRFERHPLANIYVWTYDIAAVESTKTVPEDQLTQPGAGWDVQESEGEVAEKLVGKIISLEQMVMNYKQWTETKKLRNVPILLLAGDGASTSRTQRPMTTETKTEAQAEQTKPTKAPAPKKGGKGAAKQEEVSQADLAPPPPPPPPPLPSKVEELPANDELYRRLSDEISTGNTSTTVQLHCILEQIQETTSSSAGQDRSASNAVADTIASKNRRDVADFTDYVLAHLDGTEEGVFEACRRRRLKAAEVLEARQNHDSENASSMTNNPLHVGDIVRLIPHTQSSIDGGALLLGLPLSSIESRVYQAVYKSPAIGAPTVVRTDFPGIKTYEDAQHLLSQLLREKCGASVTDATTLLDARSHVELLSARQFGERLSEITLLPSTTKVVEAHCVDGTKAVILLHSHPSDRKRWRSTWAPLQGAVNFPKWLQWREHVQKEDLHFNPPPKNDDDEEEELLPPPEEEEEEEEEFEEEEEELDEDGNPKPKPDDDDLDLAMDDDEEPQQRRRKKKKKMIHYDPEYIDFEAKATEEQRRRATMEHIRALVQQGADTTVNGKRYQTLLANNHSANVAYEEESFMFPDDGNIISTSVSRVNTVGVNCTVNNGQGLLFGFRASVPAKGSLAEAGPTKSSGVAGIVSVRNEALFHIECSATGPEPEPSLTENGTSVPPTPHSVQPTEDAQTAASPAVQPVVHTTVRCSTKGLTITVDTIKGTVFFDISKESARDCPLTVYQPATQQVTRIFTAEVSRYVQPNGLVLSTYADGTKMNLFPNGNTAVLHKGYWMITNAQGRRVLKNVETGKVQPLVMSLVTTNTDVETQSKVTTREDGVVTVHYDDGRMLVQHIEGTRMWQDANRTIVEVETEGLPLVCCTESPVSRLTPTPSPTPGEEPGARGQLTEPLLCVKFVSGLYLSVRPRKRVTIGHFHMGFSAALELSAFLMRMVPSVEHDNTYCVDYAFGGLRSCDHGHAYIVTPKGRTRSRVLADELAEIELDPTQKQVIDVFGGLEIVSHPFADLVAQTGFDVDAEALHRQKTSVVRERIQAAAVENDIIGFAPPPRSRQMRDKERKCVTKLRSVIPQTNPNLPLNLPPHLFIVQPNGQAIELMRQVDVMNLVKGAVAHSDLLHSDVYTEDYYPGGQDASKETESVAAKATHVIVSVSPMKPAVRPGIPKIILDIRSGNSSAPMSVAHFLQELRQGPSHGHASPTSASPDADMVVTCSTRHFIHFQGKLQQPKRHIPSVAPKDEVYEKAATSLTKAIPPVIAAQLSVQRTAQILAASRDVHTNQRHNTRGGSRGSKEGQRQPPRRKEKTPLQQDRAVEDVEFAKQMEAMKKKEREGRKPWPNPVGELQSKLGQLSGSCDALKYWKTDEGATNLETVTAENEKYKKVNGYAPAKVDVTTASPARVRPTPVQKQMVDPPPEEPAAKPSSHQTTPKKTPSGSQAVVSVNQEALTPGRSSIGRGRRLVATPSSVNFGTIIEGFRYSSAVQLTNVAVGACRYRIFVDASCADWLSVDSAKAPIAAGMSARVDIEVSGTQALGSSTGTIIVEYDGGTTTVEVVLTTRGGQERPVPHPKTVRMIGPVKMHYNPGSSVKLHSHQRSAGPVSMDNKQYNDGSDSD